MQSKEDFFALCGKTLEGNWVKLGFAAALLVVSISVLFALAGMPVLLLVAQPSAGIFSLLFAVCGMCVMYSLFFMLFYGFFVLIIRIYKNDYVTAGFLFYGFRDWKRLFRAGCMYMLALFIASLIAAVPVLVFQLRAPDFFAKIPLTLLVTVLTLIIGALLLVLIFPYLFSVYYLYETQRDHTDNAVMPLLKKSRSQMRGKKVLLFLLCFMYARRDIVFAACALIAAQLLVFVKSAAFFASMLGYVYYVLAYVVFIKAVTVCTVFYYSLQSPQIEAEPANS